MITLNDYLYRGDTVLKILHSYSSDLRAEAVRTRNHIDIAHANFLVQQIELLEHNEFLTSQSQRLREFYKYMVKQYPFLAFTFRGRIKSLIRAEQKFNGYVVTNICDYCAKHGCFPPVAELKRSLGGFRDLIAYRIVISMPKCHLKPGEDAKELEMKYLYEIADIMPEFLEERGCFSAVTIEQEHPSDRLNEHVRPYYKDFVEFPTEYGYRSLHITFYDNIARCQFEVQLRTKEMDDFAEIGPANHLGYEKRQLMERARRSMVPEGEYPVFDEALERGRLLQELDLSKVDVNMFSAASNTLINDGCGLFRGRQILPFEHLSRFETGI